VAKYLPPTALNRPRQSPLVRSDVPLLGRSVGAAPLLSESDCTRTDSLLRTSLCTPVTGAAERAHPAEVHSSHMRGLHPRAALSEHSSAASDRKADPLLDQKLFRQHPV
jgi:hypothetical protein